MRVAARLTLFAALSIGVHLAGQTLKQAQEQVTRDLSRYLKLFEVSISLAGEAGGQVLVYGEVNEYIRGRDDYPQLHAQLVDLLKEIPPFFVTYPIMRRYGEIRRALSVIFRDRWH